MSSKESVFLFLYGYNCSVTVEQRAYFHDEQSSQPDQPLASESGGESEDLSEHGVQVRNNLLQSLENCRAVSPTLAELLAGEIAEYPVGLFNHLGLIVESPVFKAQDSQKGHWSYELTMVERTLTCAPALKESFGYNDQELADLVFMIVIGDIGKAGPLPLTDANNSDPAKVVGRIYNQAIFHSVHQNWLKTCRPETFPDQLQPVLAQIDRREPVTGGLSAWDLIFKNGTFIGLPIEVYLYVLKQVALTELGGQVEQVETLFSLSQAEKDFLTARGFDPTTTPIRKFFTSSHIQFGQDFLTQEDFLKPEHKVLVPLALAHHLSQGEMPSGLDFNELIADQKQLATCAFLEILDKVDAILHRGQFKDGDGFSQADRRRIIDRVVSITQTEIQSNLERNFPQYPQLTKLYEMVLQEMRRVGVFDFAD